MDSAKSASQGSDSTVEPVAVVHRAKPLHPDVYHRHDGLVIRGEVKVVRWDLPAKLKRLEILQITDMQWGHVCCLTKRVIEYRDWILKKPNRFMVWTGDNVDSAHMQSKGTTWENTGPPIDQVDEFCDIWACARHRVLGYVGGNHERRTLSTYGDLGLEISRRLDLPYSRGRQLINVNFGRWGADAQHPPFRITQWHGIGGARTMGTVAQNLYRFANDGESNLYLSGHHHKAMVIPFWKERPTANDSVGKIKTFAACGTSFLDNWGSYGEVAGYGPTDTLMPRAIVGLDGKDLELTLK